MEQRVSVITLGVSDLVRARSFWGGYSGVFVDPDGHAWEVAHNPHWSLHGDGSVSLS